MNFNSYKCDGCGAVKQEANHWFVVRIESHGVDNGEGRLVATGFLIFPWDAKLADVKDSLHYCGSSCLQKKQGEFVK